MTLIRLQLWDDRCVCLHLVVATTDFPELTEMCEKKWISSTHWDLLCCVLLCKMQKSKNVLIRKPFVKCSKSFSSRRNQHVLVWGGYIWTFGHVPLISYRHSGMTGWCPKPSLMYKELFNICAKTLSPSFTVSGRLLSGILSWWTTTLFFWPSYKNLFS